MSEYKVLDETTDVKKKFSWGRVNSIESMALIVSIVSLVFVVTQTITFYKQAEYMNIQIQPHFNVSTILGDRKVNGRYADEKLRIYNAGGNFYAFESNVITFLDIEHNNEKYLLPLSYYFFASQGYCGDGGTLVQESTGYENNIKFSDLNKEFNEYLLNHDDFGSIETITFLKINYQDVFGQTHTKYFDARNGRLIESEYGNEIFKLHEEYTPRNSNYNIDEIKVSDVLKYIEGKNKLSRNMLPY
ncbi:hypothetical protein [Tepidibacter sp. Z1-5]|uniref:hypothetical protein n=1 Tax=Tepidibacter sp. Z1-5 TaxID=3134138 RepID=UPI0030C636E1